MVPGHEREYKRLLMVAALCDAKDSRMSGPWKADTIDDGINYRGAFAAWRDEYEVFMREDSARVEAQHGLMILAYS